jgi:hypothetical protein
VQKPIRFGAGRTDFAVLDARAGHLAAVHCNQLPATGILVGRLRLAVPPANGWPTGDYFVQLTFRAAVLHDRPASMMNVAFELLDGVLLILDHRLDQIPDRDHRDHPSLVHDRQMPDPALGHEMHAVLHSLIE